MAGQHIRTSLPQTITPPHQPLPLPGIATVAIAIGRWHTCAIVTGGGVKCWGANSDGQLGIGSTEASTQPTDVAGALLPYLVHILTPKEAFFKKELPSRGRVFGPPPPSTGTRATRVSICECACVRACFLARAGELCVPSSLILTITLPSSLSPNLSRLLSLFVVLPLPLCLSVSRSCEYVTRKLELLFLFLTAKPPREPQQQPTP